ncbi:MAG TPA: T9SS type A sorting domain-containing protein [Flavobacteriales bacterium]|nr:T9SS type A sorting domain-containing protein [Flavobacteriales bacterium]
MKIFSLAFGLNLFVICAIAQTGPAGVGTSTNNSLWLKANAGTSTTTSGAAISTWSDASGNGNDVTQATAAQRPTYATNVMNGFPAVLFDNNTTAGQNDYMSGVDASNLDNTNGFTLFTVTRMNNLGDARSILAKRTNVGVNQAYMFFYYTSNYMYIDIESNDDRWSTTPTAFTTGTNYMLDLYYDGTSADPRSRVYSAGSLVKTGTESATSLIDYASPFLIGSTHIGDNRPFGGYMAEIIFYREALNDARRIIVNNYLSSKYNITLAANDFYLGDTPGNGDFDYDVAGIGQSGAGSSNAQFATSASAGMGITYKSGFDNGDYILAGHKLVTNSTISTDIAVVSGGPLTHRWERIWYIDVTNTSTSILGDVVFDMSDGGSTATPAVASNYKLLYRATNSGSWTIAATASSIAGDKITFTDFNFSGNAQDGYYTIGTINTGASPLPIELISFNAYPDGDKIDLAWTTAAEINNAYFTIERSKDGELWAEITKVTGAGNSNQQIDYFDVDYTPLKGTSYYRLKQTDFDGRFTYSQIVVVKNGEVSFNGDITPFPNPNDGNSFNLEFTGFSDEEVLLVVKDIQGKSYFSKMYVVSDHANVVAISLEQKLPAGAYLVVASTDDNLVSKRIIVNQ